MSYHEEDKASCHISSNTISDKYGIWNCFGCHSSGNIIQLVQFSWNISFIEALVLVEAHQRDYSNDDVLRLDKIDIKLPMFYENKKWKTKYLSYLLNRGITKKQIKLHHIGYVDAGKYINRIIVPVYLNNKLTTYVARTILPDEEYRLTSAPGGSPGLFGSELANPKYGPAIIFEGWADALAVERVGYYNCMALQTNIIHEIQFDFLKKFDYIITFPDGDMGGNIFIDSCAQYIDKKLFYVVDTPKGKDPDEVNKVEDLIGSASEWKPVKECYEVEIDF